MKRLKIIAIILLATATTAKAQTTSEQTNDTKTGPWITQVTEDSATILWTSNNPGMGWVELSDSTRIYDEFAGRRTFGTFHRVDLTGLQKGETLKYRVGGQYLTDATDPRVPKFGTTYTGDWNEVRLFDPNDDDSHFSVMNDIHMDVAKYEKLVSQIDPETTDFIFLNGDIISTGNYELDEFVQYEIAPLKDKSATLPLYFARGNHEGRGTGIKLVSEVYPNRTSNTFYYTFRQGPAAYIVLDAGETGTDRALLYSGTPVYEHYLNEQIEWAKKAMAEPDFAEAPVKVCILHVPMIDAPDQNDFPVHRWLNKHIVPILNEYGINLMIGADLHVLLECLPGTMGNNFPIVVNATCNLMDVRITNDKTIHLTATTPDGEVIYNATF